MIAIEADVFSEALKTVGAAIDTRAHLPILSGVRITVADGTMHLTGSSLRATTRTTVPASGDLDVVVPHRRLAEFVARCSGPIGLDVAGNELVAETARLDLKLRTLAVTDWPDLPEPAGDVSELTADQVAALRSVLYAAGTDQNRRALTGVQIDKKGAAATDSYRLAAVDIDFKFEALMPAAPLAEVLGDTAVKIQATDRYATFTTGATSTMLQLLADQYPNWRPLVRKDNPVTVELNREEALEAVDTVMPIGNRDEVGVVVRLEPGDGHLIIAAAAQDVGEARVRLDVTDVPDFTFHVTGKWLGDLLRSVQTDTVVLGFVDPQKPLQVHDDNRTHVLMPRRA